MCVCVYYIGSMTSQPTCGQALSLPGSRRRLLLGTRDDVFDHATGLVHLRAGIYGSVSKPCTPGEHQNSW